MLNIIVATLLITLIINVLLKKSTYLQLLVIFLQVQL
jgi:hypothetical protein